MYMVNIITKVHNSKGTFHSHLHVSKARSVMVEPVYSIKYGFSLKQIVI